MASYFKKCISHNVFCACLVSGLRFLVGVVAVDSRCTLLSSCFNTRASRCLVHVRFVSGSGPVCARFVRVCFVSGSCQGSCLVCVWIVSGSYWVRVGFVAGSCYLVSGSCPGSGLGPCLVSVRI